MGGAPHLAPSRGTLGQPASPSGLPARGGIGLKSVHFEAVLEAASRGAVPLWVEVHPQNYMMEGGPMHRWLEAVSAALPVSFHSVGLSMGDPDGLDRAELERLAMLVDRYQPASVSDHLAFSSIEGQAIPDLLPVPMTAALLDHFARQVDIVQQRLGRTILVENPSRMTAFTDDKYEEIDFLQALAAKTGCGLLIDVNNILVTRTNLGIDPHAYVDAIDGALVGEIHVAGHSIESFDGGAQLAIDDHGSPVSEECWALLARLTDRIGPRPVLVERDNDIPDFAALEAEAARADAILTRELADAA